MATRQGVFRKFSQTGEAGRVTNEVRHITQRRPGVKVVELTLVKFGYNVVLVLLAQSGGEFEELKVKLMEVMPNLAYPLSCKLIQVDV